MNIQTLLFSILCFALIGCYKKEHKAEMAHANFKYIPDVIDKRKYSGEYELFVSSERDSSTCSFILRENREYMFIQYCTFPHTRYSQYDPISGGLKIVSYNEMLTELDECLRILSEKRDIKKLVSFTFGLSGLGDVAVSATNNYNRCHPNDDNYNSDDVLKAVSETSLINDFNEILCKYGVEVYKLECPEYIVFLVKKERFLMLSTLDKKSHVPERVIDMPIEITLRELRCNK